MHEPQVMSQWAGSVDDGLPVNLARLSKGECMSATTPSSGATLPLSHKLTNKCKWLVSLAISHASAKHECVWAHTSDALPTRELKLMYVKLKNTHEYLQTNTRVLANQHASTHTQTREYSHMNLWELAIELASARKWTHKYSQSNSGVLEIICMGNNFRGCVMQSFK